MKMTKTDRDFLVCIKAGHGTIEQLEVLMSVDYRCAVRTCAKLAKAGYIVDRSGLKNTSVGNHRNYKLASSSVKNDLSDYAKDLVRDAIATLRKHDGMFGELIR
jgi:hypothetical protein